MVLNEPEIDSGRWPVMARPGSRIVFSMAAFEGDVRTLVRRVYRHIGVEDQQLRFFHHAVQFVAVRNIHHVSTAVPRWQGRQVLGLFAGCCRLCEYASEPGFHQCGHCCASSRRLFTKTPHYGIVNVKSRLHMGDRINRPIRHERTERQIVRAEPPGPRPW